MALNVTPGSGASVASDLISSDHYQILKVAHGTTGSATVVSATSPLPTREPVKGNALSKGGITSSGSSQQLVASNTSRTTVEISNSGTTGVWLAFGSAAVAGQGTFLPPTATGYWPTTAAITVINASGGTNGAIGYTEW